MLNPRLMPVPVMIIHGQYDDVADLDGLLPFFVQLPNPRKQYVDSARCGPHDAFAKRPSDFSARRDCLLQCTVARYRRCPMFALRWQHGVVPANVGRQSDAVGQSSARQDWSSAASTSIPHQFPHALKDVLHLRQNRVFQNRLIGHKVSFAATRRTGASSWSNSSSAMRAAISAP